MSQENFNEYINYMMNMKNNNNNSKKVYINLSSEVIRTILYDDETFGTTPRMTLEEANLFRNQLQEERRMARDTNPNQ